MGCTCERGSRLLVTSLFNRVQPLILELSDVMAADRRPSPCGRALVRATAIAGRTDGVAERLAAAGVARPDVVPDARALGGGKLQMVVADRRAVTPAGVGAL